jgi:hypothetical protein
LDLYLRYLLLDPVVQEFRFQYLGQELMVIREILDLLVQLLFGKLGEARLLN